MSINILIIEDDPSFVLEIEMILNEVGNFELTSTDNVIDAKSLLNKKFELIILDMRLRENTLGLELLQEIKERKIPFIVSTAFNDKDFYDKTKEYGPEAYLVKPFDKLTLMGILDKVFGLDGTDAFKYTVDGLFVKENKEHQKLFFKDIKYIKAEGNYSTIYLIDNKRTTVRNSIKSFVEKMPASNFIRAHRSYIVNVSYITALEFPQNTITIDNEIIPIGRNYKKKLKEKMI